MEYSIAQRAATLTTLIHDKLGVRGGDGLDAKLSHAGRRVPKFVHREGKVIVEALALEGHPKLAPQIDHKRVNRAFANLNKHFGAIDPRKRRLEKLIDWLAFVGFVAFAIVACTLALMIWRGLI